MNEKLANNHLRFETRTATQFIWLVPYLTLICQRHGYALGVHGSMITDLDVIACPWEEGAADAEVLKEAIIVGVGGYIPPNVKVPNIKPHGRLGWPIFLHPNYHIDLSIMPKQILSK